MHHYRWMSTRHRFVRFASTAVVCVTGLFVNTTIAEAQLPAGWTGTDVGNPSPPGSHNFAEGVFTLKGSGTGIPGQFLTGTVADQCHYVAKQVSGDVELVIRLTSFRGGPDAQIGIAIREDDSGLAAMGSGAFVRDGFFNVSSRSGVHLPGTIRTRTDVVCPDDKHPPIWFRLVRLGHNYAVSRSSDGKTWVPLQNVSGGEFSKDVVAKIGLFVSSGDLVSTATATFDNLYLGPPRLTYKTTWVGNTYSSDAEGFVPARLTGFYVAPDGTCYKTASYDEAGYPVAMFKDGKVITNIHNENVGPAFEGAITGYGDHVYLRTGGATPGVLRRSASFNAHSQVVVVFPAADPLGHTGGIAAGLDTDGKLKIYVSDVKNNKVRVIDGATNPPKQIAAFAVDRCGPLAVDVRGDVWILQRATDYPCSRNFEVKYAPAIRCYSPTGIDRGRQITDLVNPSALAVDLKADRLLVCENGPHQNIRVYTQLATTPTCTSTFGQPGGVYSGTPGLAKDAAHGEEARFCGPAGIGIDDEGNLYVASNGVFADIGKFDKTARDTWSSTSAWRLQSLFGTCVDFDPASDGKDVYSPDKHLTFDPAKTAPGSEWNLRSVTWSPFQYNERPGRFGSVVMRRFGEGNPLFQFTMMQYGHHEPIRFYRFSGEMAVPCGSLFITDSKWALWCDANGDGVAQAEEQATAPAEGVIICFDVDLNGDLWVTTGSSGSIAGIYQFLRSGTTATGVPTYSLAEGRRVKYAYPTPITGTQTGAQIRYDRAADVLYLKGNDASHPAGIVCRYDRWRAGNRTAAFTIAPLTPKESADFMYTSGTEFRYTGMDVAGDKIFVSELWGPIHVYHASDGSYVTRLIPGAEVSGVQAWEDMVQGLRAFKRSNGEYLIAISDAGFRDRNLVYRWKP